MSQYCLTTSITSYNGALAEIHLHRLFSILNQAIIGPPTVHLSGCGDCLKIKISLPKGSGKKDQLLQFYTSVSFKVSWKKAGENKSNEIWISSGKYLLQNLQAGDQYCVRVLPWINSNRNTRPSAWQCEYTSKEEPRGVVYLVSWSLGATISGLCVLVLAVSLFYTGSVCKIMTPLPKPMINIAQAHYLHPEQTVTESVSLPDDQLMSRFENNPTKNNHTLNVQQHLQEERRDEKNYANKVDTEDENDYDDEDEEGGCTYMGCVINHSDLESNNCEENSLHDCSGVCHTEDEAALDLVVIMPSQLECEEEVMSEMSAEITRPEITETQLEKNAPGYSSGNVNLFSVTLSALGPQEDNEELCEPLIPKPLESEVLQVRIPLMTIRTAEEFEGTSASVQTEIIKTDVLMSIGSLLSVCSPVLDIQNESDTVSGYMVTHSGHMHKQNTDSSEESDYCDTNYITR
ncbi:uncharacterized protein LOC127446839 isoform X2 [Myxocyprinus asiaticus]|uniref:uncharacterized protein LOC127446839 isoform X2 n=1 Tax=Myxocyprinus asiaticus TaxID=70543 RepID=UPI0022217642|nr:uncharacterized protein LOC127446839 isoform X2 [Myxocyprinus asiaticus]